MIRSLGCALLLTGCAAAVLAQDVAISPDITIVLSNGTVVDDESVVEVTSGPPTLADLGTLPPQVEVQGYHFDEESIHFSIDTITELPGSVLAEPRDVIKYAPSSYGIAFKGGGNGVPRGVGIDAVTFADGLLVMSFDTTVDFGSFVAHDDDLVIDDNGTLQLFLDASSTGIEPSLDLDAAHVMPSGDILASFDGHGTVGGFTFADEDTLVFDGGGWDIFLKGLSLDDDFAAGDVTAFSLFDAPPPPAVLFADGFESGNTSAWSSTVP